MAFRAMSELIKNFKRESRIGNRSMGESYNMAYKKISFAAKKI